MKFTNFRLLAPMTPGDDYTRPIPEGYFDGWEESTDFVIVGKVRPWDESDPEHVLYSDGDLVLADVVNS